MYAILENKHAWLPRSSVNKASAQKAGDAGLILGWKDTSEKEMVNLPVVSVEKS